MSKRPIRIALTLVLSAAGLGALAAPAHAAEPSCEAGIVGTGTTVNHPESWWGGQSYQPAVIWNDTHPRGTTYHQWTKFKCSLASDPDYDYYGLDAESFWTIDKGNKDDPATIFQQIYTDTPSEDGYGNSTDSYVSHSDCGIPVDVGVELGIVHIGTSMDICKDYGINRYGHGPAGALYTGDKAGEYRHVETAFMEKVPKGIVPKFEVDFGIPQYQTAWDPGTIYYNVTSHIAWDYITDAGGWKPGAGTPSGPVSEVYGNSSGWHDAPSGMTMQKYSAVSMGGQWPQVLAIRNGYIHQVYGDSSGWHDGNTGVFADDLSAVNMGGQWPQAMALSGGQIEQVWGDSNGWHYGATGIWADQISAVNMGGQWPQAIALEGGVIHQIYGNSTGWHDASLNITADHVSAVNMGGQWPQIIALRGGVIHQIYGDGSGWHDVSLNMTADQVSAVNMGAAWPQIMAIRGGVVHQIYGDTHGWHDGNTGIAGRAISAVNLGQAWPVSMVVK